MRKRFVDKNEYSRLASLASEAVKQTTFAEINTTEFDNFPSCDIRFVYETDFNATLKHYVDADILRTTYKILTPTPAIKVSFGTKHKYLINKNPRKGEVTLTLTKLVRDAQFHIDAINRQIETLKKELALGSVDRTKNEIEEDIKHQEGKLPMAIEEFQMFTKQLEIANDTSQADIGRYFCFSNFFRYYTYPIIAVSDKKGAHHSDHVAITRMNFVVLDDKFEFKKRRSDSLVDEHFRNFKRISQSGLYDFHYRELPKQLGLF